RPALTHPGVATSQKQDTLRVLKLARYSSAVDRFSEAFDDIKDELALFSGVTAVMTFIAAYGIWEFEHETNDAYGNLFECVYWSVASLTMGAEGIAPSTVAGKILAMLLVLIGLGIVAVPSGLFASALSKTGDPSP
ncbi:MAG: ion channel, partial [bacterium]|nr:ion channel [bacterium]